MRSGALRHPGVELHWYSDLRALPWRVARFQARAPGVREAVRELGLEGRLVGTLVVATER